jgi:hypothetical protein
MRPAVTGLPKRVASLVPVGGAGLLAALALLAARPAAANVYTYVDADGVLHYTNIEPPRGKGSKWHKIDVGPGKAATISGASSSGCKVSRVDVVPARDRAPDRYVRYDGIIAEAAHLYAIPEALIRAIIKVESDYDPRVVSCAGAKGLMQVMPYEEKSERIDHVFDPRENILAGTRMLRSRANHFNAETPWAPTEIEIDRRSWPADLVLTIASYHAGVGAVTKYRGVPPYETTQQYVRMVLKQYERYKARAVGAR